jgi:hypothetical protein
MLFLSKADRLAKKELRRATTKACGILNRRFKWSLKLHLGQVCQSARTSCTSIWTS